jgi:hypothetical protein
LTDCEWDFEGASSARHLKNNEVNTKMSNIQVDRNDHNFWGDNSEQDRSFQLSHLSGSGNQAPDKNGNDSSDHSQQNASNGKANAYQL